MTNQTIADQQRATFLKIVTTVNGQRPVKGDKIVTVYGNTYEVAGMEGNMVKVYHAQGLVHIAKVSRIIR